ncbi:MAG TPA: hypothetical protein VM687_15670 [Stenotrophomonas sp.]|nr:hypothetical protein [Stenotrophomonas sp.]
MALLISVAAACQQRPSSRTGGDSVAQDVPDAVKDVSAFALVADPARFDGRRISVKLYYPARGSKLMFAGSDSYNMLDYPSSVVVNSDLTRIVEGNYVVSGRFQVSHGSRSGPVPLSTAGAITEVTAVRLAPSMRAAELDCPGLDCRIEFIEGLTPHVNYRREKGAHEE